ncbi:MAG: cation-translocating P-type ATPase [Defluviitaleaceae bacterium]|nr:cation-translocating P-type ATPase [Defluviitaleaceae bacterium]MCL2835396.1 cation-translocating P-type ATPase [Defluviitaleaceae bacterium]
MGTGFHYKSVNQSLLELKTNAQSGLSAADAMQRLEQNGPNRLQSAKKKSLFLRVLAQFKDFLVIILIIAAIISVIAGDGVKDAVIIIGILIVNMIIGITQENKADNALKELKSMSSPKAKVKRDGRIGKIDSDNVVVGDIVILDAGDYIPADIRIIESVNLKIDESALTGESVPVEKNAHAVLDRDAGLGDRFNAASMGTVVTYGRGAGVVCATGMDTEMGKIAAILNETDEANTPLQDKLNAMAKMLGIICIITCAFIFGVGLLYRMDILEMLMVSVSLAVAAVPEGVAIVATVILAIGVQKMVKSNVIVKKLRAVETLGSTTVICSDKTGTMTQNKMTVVKVFDTENIYEVTGTGYNATGEVVAGDKPVSQNISLMAEIAVLCNDAVYDRENVKIIGDPTEAAMLVFGAKLGVDKDELSARYKRVREMPFDSDRKLMSSCNIKDGKIIMNVKGAADAILKRSARLFHNGAVIPMTEEMRKRLVLQNEQFAAQALRVLGFAYKEYSNETEIDDIEEDLIYAGMMCMIDPPRAEVKEAVDQCRSAGITVKMITGDHKITGSAIAQSLGIMQPGDEALDGNELNGLTDEQLKEKVKHVNVFARVSPEHKVRLVSAVKENNNIVAMTGDGVNDAPALKKADIGIAMGITGTDVSKEAADMILTDDNFVSIVKAVEQGRTIYGNIRKVTGYLLACNIGEILVILLAIVCGLPVPLVATQLLFVNLLTDALPAFALGMEGKEPGIMKKQPRAPKEPIINKTLKGSVAFRAVFLCAGTLGAFLYGLNFHCYETAVSMAFFTLVAGELLASYTSRTESYAGFGRGLFANRFLNISMGISLLILLSVIYIPFLNGLFTTVPLTALQFAIGLTFVLLPVIGGEYAKKFFAVN